MPNVDSHQHFWRFTEKDYGWIGEEGKVLKRDFLPEELLATLTSNKIDACVAVQARQSLIETDWLLQLAQQHTFIAGVVGWIDLKSADVEQQLKEYKKRKALKGFRHVLQDETDPNFMLDRDFVRGLRLLAKYNFTYDLLIYSHQLPQAIKLLELVPELQVVIDHIAKPNIATGRDFDRWKSAMSTMADHGNVYCKVSGMVTEANPKDWEAKDFKPYLDVIFSAYGSDRVMFGSDWPVCLLGGSYSDIKNIVVDYVNANHPESYDKVFGNNATIFYKL